MSKYIPLGKTCKYSSEKIKLDELTLGSYITTDNILQNKQGVTIATNLPPQGNSFPKYNPGNILVGNIRPYLKKIWFADNDGGCSADVLVFDVKKGFYPKFVYYAMFQDDFFVHAMKGSKGTKMPRGDKNQMMEYQIPDIDFNSQKQIANVLSSLDSKIALNNRINAELEAIAKMVYDYWFVQFDFPFDFASTSLSNNAQGKPASASIEGVTPSHPINNNAPGYKSSGGKMVWSEELKREVPAGWAVGELKDIANITMGQSPAGESYNEDRNGMVFYQGCTDFGTRFPTIRKYTTEPTRFARQGDILLSVRAPVGTLNIAKEDCCIGRGLAALNSKDNCIAFLFGVMVNLKQIFDRRNVDGTTFGSITKDDLFTLKVVKPSNEVLEMYHKLINPCFEKQNLIADENQQLSSLRDWLLPMLMNGQVSVSEL